MRRVLLCPTLSLFVLASCWSAILRAQPGGRYIVNFNNGLELLTDMSGKPIHLKVEYNMEGTPFYPAEYTKADLYAQNGKVYRGLSAKFNLMENLLLLQAPDGSELVATNYIRGLYFTDAVRGEIPITNYFQGGFPKVAKLDENTYYEVLDTGKVKLLKYRSVSYIDQKPYASATITRVFEQAEDFYLYIGGQMKKIDKGKDALLSLITDKKDELRKYIEDKNLKCRKESEWKDAISYYNSLFRAA